MFLGRNIIGQNLAEYLADLTVFAERDEYAKSCMRQMKTLTDAFERKLGI